MRWKIWRPVAPAATLWLAALILLVFRTVPAAADNARWGADYFPNVTLTTQNGAPVRFYDDLVKGKIVAINLIYTTCKYACPLETARLSQVAKLLGDRMGRDVFFYSITIDPDHDTPEVLKEYAAKYQAGPGWTFLTGKQADIDLISKKLGLYAAPNPSNPDGHQPFLLVGNEETGQWMRNSAVDNPSFMARTIGDWLDSWQNAKKETLKSYTEVPARLTLDRGQYTFANHCAACHTIGRGDHLGPDLLGVTAARDRDWLTRFIVAPDQVRAALRREARRIWLSDCFEVVELHVRPGAQGHGLGAAQLGGLLGMAVAKTTLLSTPEADEQASRAWRLYRRFGFVDVLRDFYFPGDDRAFAILGRALPLA